MAITKISTLSKLSHELKTPIHGIAGISNHLLQYWDRTDEQGKKKCLKAIVEASDTLASIVNSMLDKRSDEGNINFNYAEIDLVQLVKSSIEKCINLYLNRSELNIIFDSILSECIMNVDTFWINQLLINLMSNAINGSRYCKMIVSMKLEEVDGLNKCTISVKDEGVGIPQENLVKIFQPFYRRSNLAGSRGTGLGLAICREIAEAHGGKIFASNNIDKGSKIEFYLIDQLS